MINKRENAVNKSLNDPNGFIEFFNSMDDVYDDINDYNPKRKKKVLIIFDNMIADVMTNKKCQFIIKKLYISKCESFLLVSLFLLVNLISLSQNM